MTCLQPATTRNEFPLRYWSLVAIMIGVPNFLKFDNTGLTHNFGLFNITSLSSIVLTCTVALILGLVSVVTRSSIVQRKVDVYAWMWIALLINLTISSFLQPSEIAGHRVPEIRTDLPLSLYRLCEWTLVFVLILSVYSRESEKTATNMVVGLIGMVSWAKIILIWATLAIIPSLVYSAGGETGFSRLGGTVLHPVYLAVFSSFAFFYTLMFVGGRLRILGCSVALLTLAMTYARSEQVIFALILLAYLLTARNRRLKLIGIVGVLSVTAGAVVASGRFLQYLARGEGERNIVTLSERTIVWDASFRAFRLRPWIGFGFISGPKHALQAEWTSAHWLPPHCHSDFVQALVSGGVPAAILVVAIQCVVLWKAFKGASEGPKRTFLLIAVVQLVIMSNIEVVVITSQFGDLGCLFLLCYVGVTAASDIVRSRMPRRVTWDGQRRIHEPIEA